MGKVKRRRPDTGTEIWAERSNVRDYLKGRVRATADQIDDALSAGVMAASEHVSIRIDRPTRKELFDLILKGAQFELRKQERTSRRNPSLNAPLSKDEPQSAELGDIATLDRSEQPIAEDYADAMKLARASGCLDDRDSEILLCMADGLTAEAMAVELGITPNEARTERVRIINRINEIRRAQ